jgi:hypothetical protein
MPYMRMVGIRIVQRNVVLISQINRHYEYFAENVFAYKQSMRWRETAKLFQVYVRGEGKIPPEWAVTGDWCCVEVKLHLSIEVGATLSKLAECCMAKSLSAALHWPPGRFKPQIVLECV